MYRITIAYFFHYIRISGIRRLQVVLVKVALVLGVSVSTGVEFRDLLEPVPEDPSTGWRVKVNPSNHYLNKLNIDVLVGAEGTKVTVPGMACM